LVLNQVHIIDWYDFPGYIIFGPEREGGGGGGGGHSHYYGKGRGGRGRGGGGGGKGGGGKGGGRGKRSTTHKDASDFYWLIIAFGS